MRKIMLTALTLALVIGGATAVFAAVGDDPAPRLTSTATTTSTAEDVSGPCDEAEHANDPRCAGGDGRNREAGDQRGRGVDDDAGDVREAEIGEDIPGPCDEAEHANDPRCAAGAPAGQVGAGDREEMDDDPGEVDNSGPGSVNSGPGSVNSGHSEEADDHGGESGHSGPGGGGEADDD